jgi:hypothetical protein
MWNKFCYHLFLGFALLWLKCKYKLYYYFIQRTLFGHFCVTFSRFQVTIIKLKIELNWDDKSLNRMGVKPNEKFRAMKTTKYTLSLDMDKV